MLRVQASRESNIVPALPTALAWLVPQLTLHLQLCALSRARHSREPPQAEEPRRLQRIWMEISSAMIAIYSCSTGPPDRSRTEYPSIRYTQHHPSAACTKAYPISARNLCIPHTCSLCMVKDIERYPVHPYPVNAVCSSYCVAAPSGHHVGASHDSARRRSYLDNQ